MNLDVLKQQIQSYLDQFSLYLYDVIYEQNPGSDNFLIVMIEDLDLDQVMQHSESINNLVDKYFDKNVKEAYFLDISSAGIFRELKTQEHFDRAINKNVVVTTKNNKINQGSLVEVEQDFIVIATKDEDIQISRNKIKQINLDA